MSWMTVARTQAGLITYRQLRECDVPARTIGNWRGSGRLETISARGVYRVAGAPRTADWPAWFAVLRTRSPLSYLSAARWWDIPVPDDGLVHITRFDRKRLRWPPGVRVHRVELRPADVTRHRAQLLTTRTETLLDCLGWLSFGAARTLADRAVSQNWLRPANVSQRLDEQGGRWGNRQLRRLVGELGGGADAESERILHRLLREHLIIGWTPNVPVVIDGSRWVIDVAFPQLRLAIEVDGYAYHSGDDRFQNDRTKQNALMRAGWRVLRFTWADLHDRPDHVIAEICSLLAA